MLERALFCQKNLADFVGRLKLLPVKAQSLRVNASFTSRLFSELGVYCLSLKEESLEERKAKVLIKLRGYRLVKRKMHEDAISFLVDVPREKEKALIWCVPGESTVGITAIGRMQKAMKEADVERGIMVTGGRHTHAVKQSAKKRKIELIPKTFPAFDLFEHKLVPKHEILAEEETTQLLAQYRVHPYQLPQIKASDPAVKAIGAKPGDVLRVIRKSSTAGEHIAYRYVVE
jgi:DNA-directed RNA polymerase subunit H